MTATPNPPPEATLLRLAREAAGLSPESAAARMTVRFSGSRWRQIEAAYRKDTASEVVAKAPTLAQMAHALGITPDRLEAAGRSDAADILREIETTAAPQPAPPSTATFAGLEDWQQKAILNVLDAQPRSTREKALLLHTLAEQIERQAKNENASPS
ncbi:helix-turn-helix domain-containing protein [Streptomyces sp. R302]|uniref:helix-turn-helix domain-containing protein n=1 Tax=unclassified Streptomyces TaxID=2593676 RepID=UPI00145FA6AF|nr:MULTISPECIES: helix-turn-helix transcriptional regulator [unclassified Streptomyces]NML55302.1 helix-turn-helix domain-containing protein [Streptomyces sp. R301]NML80174.1 helix-turn-helix domain-containing protein [Streptomyces sp. R302]